MHLLLKLKALLPQVLLIHEFVLGLRHSLESGLGVGAGPVSGMGSGRRTNEWEASATHAGGGLYGTAISAAHDPGHVESMRDP